MTSTHLLMTDKVYSTKFKAIAQRLHKTEFNIHVAMPCNSIIPKSMISLEAVPRELLATQVYPPVKLLVKELIVSVLDIASDEMLNLLFEVMTRFYVENEYHIYLIKRPGVYFISKSVEGVFKRDGYLFEMGVYWPCLLQTLAQQQLYYALFGCSQLLSRIGVGFSLCAGISLSAIISLLFYAAMLATGSMC